MKTELLNDIGTLITFTSLDDTVISPLPENEGGHGGAFWCLPNFDEGIAPFTVRHGEYRKTPGAFVGEATVSKTISGPWGELHTKASWVFGETGLTTSMSLSAKRHETAVRPGFHPYFALQKPTSSYHIIIGNTIIESATILENMKMVVPCISEDGVIKATLINGIHASDLTFSVRKTNKEEPFSFAICLWTDQKDKYICIEPVCGIGYDESGFPKPFTLKENETLDLEVTILFRFS